MSTPSCIWSAYAEAIVTVLPICRTPAECIVEDGSSPRLLLLLLPQRHQTHTRNLDHLESHTRNITLRLALTTETCEEHFVVLVHEVQATVIGD